MKKEGTDDWSPVSSNTYSDISNADEMDLQTPPKEKTNPDDFEIESASSRTVYNVKVQVANSPVISIKDRLGPRQSSVEDEADDLTRDWREALSESELKQLLKNRIKDLKSMPDDGSVDIPFLDSPEVDSQQSASQDDTKVAVESKKAAQHCDFSSALKQELNAGDTNASAAKTSFFANRIILSKRNKLPPAESTAAVKPVDIALNEEKETPKPLPAAEPAKSAEITSQPSVRID